MESLQARLRRTVDEFERELSDHSTNRLERYDDLSINEQYVLSQLGPREQWSWALINLGASALQLAQDLSGANWKDNYITQDAVDPAGPYFGIPKRGLELAAAKEFVDGLPGLISRTKEVVWLALNANLSPRVAGYLRRLGRCYVAGFDAEVLILCRSVLDVALRDVVGDGRSGPKNMAERIELLRNRGSLSDEAIEAAHEVRVRGNKAVHEEPGDPSVTAETLAKTINVLRELLDDELEAEWG